MTNDLPESFFGTVGQLHSADADSRIPCIYFVPGYFLSVISGQFLFFE